jgi:hypothetical protein
VLPGFKIDSKDVVDSREHEMEWNRRSRMSYYIDDHGQANVTDEGTSSGSSLKASIPSIFE